MPNIKSFFLTVAEMFLAQLLLYLN